MPVAEVNNPVSPALGRHQRLDLDHPGQPPQNVRYGAGRVIAAPLQGGGVALGRWAAAQAAAATSPPTTSPSSKKARARVGERRQGRLEAVEG